ncbi:hypothetical protein [Sphingobacterium siyangense]|uniref:hypothetical protein n=1 Tax=Sphingobacterium siyangense TaxID=459529 RepID=UPI0028AEB767|nr:hypothetical protein [Sphingobacterium siyangense]
MAAVDHPENELHLYINGKPVYKRRLDTDELEIFNSAAYEKYRSASQEELLAVNGMLIVKAKIRLTSTKNGGRKTGITSGYRPNHVFEYTSEAKVYQFFTGDIYFEGEKLMPGEETIATVRLHLTKQVEKYLTKGRKWWLYEVPNLIGEAEIL